MGIVFSLSAGSAKCGRIMNHSLPCLVKKLCIDSAAGMCLVIIMCFYIVDRSKIRKRYYSLARGSVGDPDVIRLRLFYPIALVEDVWSTGFFIFPHACGKAAACETSV